MSSINEISNPSQTTQKISIDEGVSQSPNNQKKRRKRVTHTCTSCKAKKIKCDLQRPCSSCTKKGIPAELCIYEKSPFIPTVENSKDNNETIILLKQEKIKLQLELDELRSKYQSGVAFQPLMKHSSSDRTIKLSEKLTKPTDKIAYHGPSNWISLLDADKAYEDLLKDAKLYVKQAWSQWITERNLNYMDHFNEIDVLNLDQLLQKLIKFLPDYDSMEHYLQIFINSYWNYSIPVIDSTELIKDFHEIFSKDPVSNSYKIIIKNKNVDYSKIAIILLCLKFVIFTLNSIYVDLKIDMNDHLIRYAERLLSYSDYHTNSSIPTLQALILLKDFKKINPAEDRLGDNTGVALLSRVSINMAILMGLNRNIDELYSHETERVKSNLKSIWRYLFQEDSFLSLDIGIPLSIENRYVDKSFLNSGDLKNDLVLIVREATELLSTNQTCKESQILNIIKKIENYNDGELVKFASVIRDFKTPESIMSSFEDITILDKKMSAIYLVFVLYNVLLVGLEESDESDPIREAYFNANLKYAILSVTHFIELLLKLNSWCKKIADNGDQINKQMLYNIVEISYHFSVLSRSMFIKGHTTLCRSVFSFLSTKKPITLTRNENIGSLSLTVDDMESLDIYNPNEKLNQLIKDVGFLHGLMTLQCKYMLHLNNQSFGKVFSMSFCLHAVIAVYTFFNGFLQKHLPKEKVSEVFFSGANPNVKYEQNLNHQENENDILGKVRSIKNHTNKFSLNNILASTTPDTSNSENILQSPDLISTSDDSEIFDLFGWKNDTIDQLFDSLFTDESLTSFDPEKLQQVLFNEVHHPQHQSIPEVDSSTKDVMPPSNGFTGSNDFY